jgi:hypothetical protein
LRRLVSDFACFLKSSLAAGVTERIAAGGVKDSSLQTSDVGFNAGVKDTQLLADPSGS